MKIYCNTIRNEYDIRPLVASFYPGCSIEYVVVNSTDIVCEEADSAVLVLEDERITVSSSGKTSSIDIPGSCSTKEYRDILKRHIYSFFRELTGRKNSWGTLTGVRPSKIPMAYLQDGLDRDDIIVKMKDEYYCSEEKATLAADIAITEADILKKIDYENGYSIYIGIPFCPTVCNYCSFSSISLAKLKNAEQLVDDYIEALRKECEAFGRLPGNARSPEIKTGSSESGMLTGKKLTSLYVGGGTPTALDERHLDILMKIIHDNFDVDNTFEFCVEAGRPDSITEEKLRIMKQAGVGRISINPQTMKNETLKLMGRAHTTNDIIRAYDMARLAGFDNINMDLIAGLMGENHEDFRNTFDKITELDPESITVHSLVVKRASQLRTQREEETDSNIHGTTAVESMLSYASLCAFRHGYTPYYMYRQKNKAGLGDNSVLENVGYSKPGKEGIYNILIMEEKQPIIAFGAGASSKLLFGDRIERVVNVKSVPDYISRIDEMINRKFTAMS